MTGAGPGAGNTMTYKGYTAKMEFDVEDKIIVGRVQSFPNQV